jgi:uncharacterized membrane protein YdbT with pleckstrin-like domain
MFEQKEVYKLPKSAKTYAVAKLISLLTLISLPFALIPAKGIWFSTWTSLLILIGLPFTIVIILKYSNISFSIDDNKIIINWGVFSTNTKTIISDSIQNVTLERGLLMRICGVSVLKIWTSSQSQINFNRNGNSAKPDGLLVLGVEDATWLNEYITNKR